jgi:hypothetical protein
MAQLVARNRQDLVRALSTITSELLEEKGYLCFIDVFMHLGYLSKSDYENWRFRRVSPLERVLTVNLSRINFIMKTTHVSLILETNTKIWKFSFVLISELNTTSSLHRRLQLWWQVDRQLSPKSD